MAHLRRLALALAVFLVITGFGPGANPPQQNQTFWFNVAITLTTNVVSTSFIPVSAGKFAYITDFDCTNSSASASTISLQNGSGGTTIYQANIPANFGFMRSFATPLGGMATMTIGTAVFIQGGSSVTSLFCNAEGYFL